MRIRNPRAVMRSLAWSLAALALCVAVVALAAPGASRDSTAVNQPESKGKTGGKTSAEARADTSADSTAALMPEGNAKKGKKSYRVKCVACHKRNGSGGFKVTKNPTPDWRNAKRMSDPKFDDAYLRDCITNGKIESGMVAWEKQGMKTDEIENLIAYIRTFSEKKSKKAKKK